MGRMRLLNNTTIHRIYWLLVLLVLSVSLAACQSIAGDNVPATLEYELTAYATQAVSLRQSAQLQRTEIASTVDASLTQVAQYRAYNAELVVTVRAGQVPTPERLIAAPDGGTIPLEMLNTSDGVMRFMQVGTAGYVDPNTRCFDSHQTFFRVGQFNSVYLTALGVNVQSGTRLQVNWIYNGDLVHQSAWVAPQFFERTCVAIELTSNQVIFAQGDWSATLFVNGEPINPSAFTILEQ
jgi:hypothetical protein